LRDATPGVPPDLELVIRRATALDAGARYPTADALGQDLRAFLEGRPVAARSPSPGYLLWMLIRRNRALAATIAISCLLALAGGAFAIHRLDRAKARAEAAREDAQTNERTAVHRESIAHLAAARAAIGEGDSTAANARLARVPAIHRGWEWHHLRSQVDGSIRAYPRGGRVAHDLIYAPDGERLLAAIGDAVRICSSASGEIIREFPTGRGTIRTIDVDPAGNLLATIHRSGAVALWDLGSGSLLRELRPDGATRGAHVRFGPR
jgi:hypothetical protein